MGYSILTAVLEIAKWLGDSDVDERLLGCGEIERWREIERYSGEFGEMVGYDWEIEMWLLY